MVKLDLFVYNKNIQSSDNYLFCIKSKNEHYGSK